MNRKLEVQFNNLEKSRLQLMAELANIADPYLNLRPGAGKWSPLQVVSHLIQAEEVSFKYIEKRIKHGDQLSLPALNSRLKTFVVIHGLKLPLKFAAPERVAIVPEKLTLKDLNEEWNILRNRIKNILESAPENIIHKALYLHPVAGPMNLFNAMKFTQEHVDRHKKQIWKAIKNKKQD